MTSQISIKNQPITVTSSYEVHQKEFEKQILKSLKDSNITSLDHISGHYLIFDLSQSYWYDLGVLLWFISLLHKLKKQGNDMQLIFPIPDLRGSKADNLWSFLIRWRFFETLSICVDDPVNLLPPDQLIYMRRGSKYGFAAATDQYGQENILHGHRILEISTLLRAKSEEETKKRLDEFLIKYGDNVILMTLSKLCGWDPELVKTYVRRAIGETVINGILHSRGSFVNVSMRIDPRNITLAISDNGVGIPNVLRKAFESTDFKEKLARKDSDLITYFTEPEVLLDSRLIKLSVTGGVSSDPSHEGMGLYYLKSTILKEQGQLRIRSGKALVKFSTLGIEAFDDLLESPGTIIRIITPRKKD